MPGLPNDSEELREPGRAPDPAGLPCAGAAEQGELSRRLFDPDNLLEIFRRVLPAASRVPLHVRACSAKPAKTVTSRRAIRDGRTELVYRVEIELADGTVREVVLLGLAPVEPDFPGPELAERCRVLRDHPSAAPFQRLALHVPELRLGLLFFPVDPALPALAEITGEAAPELLAPHLAECRAGARIERCESELRHYKPGDRAVLRVRASFERSAPAPRAVYAKLFSDEHGATSHRELCALAAAARGSRWLRVPEALGYDVERRMLLLAEVPGGRVLSEWIHCLEHELPLPGGVDLARVERAVLAAAQALAALQRSGVEPAARRTYEDTLASLRKDRELLLQGAHEAPPELVRRALVLLERLEAAAPREGPLVPSHGGARHKQTLGDEHGLTFIDWDGFCRAHPALDAATFLARLRLAPITNPGRARELESIAARFRGTFLELVPAAKQGLALFEALVLTEQALRAFRRGKHGADSSAASARLASAAEERFARHR